MTAPIASALAPTVVPTVVAPAPAVPARGLATPAAVVARSLATLTPGARRPVDPAMHRVAGEFEAVFVRQLLQSAHITGSTAGPYGDMAVDALASGVTEGGGMGLARLIEVALSGQNQRDSRGTEPAAGGAVDSGSSSSGGSRSTGR